MISFLDTLRKTLVNFFNPPSGYSHGYAIAMQLISECSSKEEAEGVIANLEALSDGAFNTCFEHREFDRGVHAAIKDWRSK